MCYVGSRQCKKMGRTRNMGKDVNGILIHRLHTHDVYSCGLLCQRKTHDTTCVPEQGSVTISLILKVFLVEKYKNGTPVPT
jgi:hypothetical protein